MTEIKLVLYDGREWEKAIALIQGFWREHSNYHQTESEADKDLRQWSKEGHSFYFIQYEGEFVGFLHLGNRGARIDWLEDLFVLPEYQRNGIGSEAIRLAEDIVREYSDSLYIEAAARNEKAIRLYRSLGYNCLNTVTIRKDFKEEDFEILKREEIHNMEFEIRKIKG